ncbi:hypothetical protein OG589_13550 [Sphaerisporangium sp. NBC_01403]|uniref:hypothetical protein n=1 Tax=Sphaerisporangium TaxID=321315 RepID=UPI003245D75B
MEQREGAGVAEHDLDRWAGLTSVVTVAAVTALGAFALAMAALLVFLVVGGLD